jgi:hypothetical protein
MFVQDQVQFICNTTQVDKRILPGVLAQTKENADLVSSYLRKNCLKDGLIDASVENIYKAFVQLRSLLDWTTEPTKASNKLVQMENNFPSHSHDNSAEIKAKIAELDTISVARDKKKADEIVSSAVSFAASVSRNPHSRTYSLRETLQNIITTRLAKTPKPTSIQAQEIYDAVVQKERATP